MQAINEKVDFTIDQQWRIYLERIGVTPGMLPPIQEKEMKKAFYAGAAQILLISRDEISELEEEDAVIKFRALLNEAVAYFKSLNEKYGEKED